MKAKGFTLIELMIVVLIVAILAAVAVPLMRGRIEAAKWTEGKAAMGTVATAIRAYAAEKGHSGALAPSKADLGFSGGDLTGTYFVDDDYTYEITNLSPATFTISATATGGDPTGTKTLTQAGVWTE